MFNSVTVAARQRLRPIIMTSLAFGIGVVPLFRATGAGSGSQNAIGTSVLGGVVSATLLGIFFIPMFYVWVRSIIKGKKPPRNPDASDDTHAAAHLPTNDHHEQLVTPNGTVYAPSDRQTPLVLKKTSNKGSVTLASNDGLPVLTRLFTVSYTHLRAHET